ARVGPLAGGQPALPLLRGDAPGLGRDVGVAAGADRGEDLVLHYGAQGGVVVHGSSRAWAVRSGSGGPMYSKPAVSRVRACRMASPRPEKLGARVSRHCPERSRARIRPGCVVVEVAR